MNKRPESRGIGKDERDRIPRKLWTAEGGGGGDGGGGVFSNCMCQQYAVLPTC